jgi:hypothetical protein
MKDVATVQALLVALVLSIAGTAKLADHSSRKTASISALVKIVRSERGVLRVVRLIAVLEISLALAILVLPNTVLPRTGAAVVLFGSTLYLAWAIRAAPEAPCGCFGSVSRAPVSWRTLARAGLLSVAALIASIDGTPLTAPNRPLPWMLLVAEAILLAALSPELSVMKHWLLVGRKLPRCIYSDELPAATLERLRRSPLWAELSPYLTTAHPDDQWLESCWRLFSFPARYDEKVVAAVLAAKLPPGKLHYRAALVDEEEHRVVARIDAHDARGRAGRRFTRSFATAQ